MSLNEFDIIRTYFKRPAQHASVIQSIGDDCALLSVPSGYELAVSMDTLVSGRHFPASATAAQIAQRAFCTCLSDLAAMGAEPRWFTLGLTLPEANEQWLAEFSRGLFELADRYSCDLVGGDTTRGPLTITLQVHGIVEAGQAMTRDGAGVGDGVFVTGSLGDGAAALALLLHDDGKAGSNRASSISSADCCYLQQRFYCPEPQVAVARLIRDYASSAIDISDGFIADLQHIAIASHVGINIDVDSLPISDACRAVAGDRALSLALTGGDDYQLAFTVPDKHLESFSRHIVDSPVTITAVGQVLQLDGSAPNIRCFQHGQIFTVPSLKGYQHFAS